MRRIVFIILITSVLSSAFISCANTSYEDNMTTYVQDSSSEGTEAIEFRDDADEYLKSFRISSTDEGYSNSIGNELILFQEDGLYGYMDTMGNIIIKPQFLIADDFQGDMAKVAIAKDGFLRHSDVGQYYLYGYIDITGDLVIPYQYIYADAFRDGYACVQDEKYEYFYIDRKE